MQKNIKSKSGDAMNYMYEELPDSICVNGNDIKIVTDFREYIRLFDMLNDDSLTKMDKLFLVRQYFLSDVPDSELGEAILKLKDFISIEPDKGQSDLECEECEEAKHEKLFSYEVDFPYILSAFLRDYGIDIMSIRYMHWWKFKLLFNGLSDENEIKKRIMYRGIDPGTIKDDAERKRIIEIKSRIALPESEVSEYDIGDMLWQSD